MKITSKGRSVKVASYPRQFDKPLPTVDSIGSWWAGVSRDEDTINLDDLEVLLGGPIHFTTTSSPYKQVMLDLSVRYRNSLPFAVGRAVLSAMRVRASAHLLNLALKDLLDSLSDLDCVVGRK